MEIRSDMTVKLVQSVGSDASFVAAARVSTQGVDSESSLSADPEEARGLINFLLKNRHMSVFEHGQMTFLVEAPIFVFREWHRHRTWSFNETSARYKEMESMFWVPRDDRPLVQEGKPGHYIFTAGTKAQQEITKGRLVESYEYAYERYLAILGMGVAREVARACLPVAIYSSMYATVNPRNLMSFLSLRTKDESSMFPSYPQAEIEECARQVEEAFAEKFPITYEVWTKNGRIGS